jgi:D-glycero-D-manno-heptose 1,7-bisphosphate phosphatase
MSASDAKFDETTTGILRRVFGRPAGRMEGAIFLDRDGVINRRIAGGYVTRWSEFEFLPRAIDGIVALVSIHAPIIVISNQAGVGKGLVTVENLGDITERFVAAVRDRGGRIDAVYYCPHAPSAECTCRKPKPGLLLQAASDWGIDLRSSVFIGDSSSDVAAARAVGARPVLVAEAGAERAASDPNLPPVAANLVEAAAIVTRLREQLLDRA